MWRSKVPVSGGNRARGGRRSSSGAERGFTALPRLLCRAMAAAIFSRMDGSFRLATLAMLLMEALMPSLSLNAPNALPLRWRPRGLMYLLRTMM